MIRGYLEHRNLAGMEALVLGCTHYPLIRREVEEILGSGVKVLDPPAIVARHVRGELEARGQLHQGDTPSGDDHFFLSDLSDSFAKSARRFFRRSMTVEEMRLWDQ